MCLKLELRSSLGWLLVRLIEPFSRRLRKPWRRDTEEVNKADVTAREVSQMSIIKRNLAAGQNILIPTFTIHVLNSVSWIVKGGINEYRSSYQAWGCCLEARTRSNAQHNLNTKRHNTMHIQILQDNRRNKLVHNMHAKNYRSFPTAAIIIALVSNLSDVQTAFCNHQRALIQRIRPFISFPRSTLCLSLCVYFF